MKLTIEIDASLSEPEVILRCPRADEEALRLQRRILGQDDGAEMLTLYKDGGEFYLPAKQILFFETESEQVYAHTERDAYRVKKRLYELEAELPRMFIRVSKSTIVNTTRIYAVTRDFVSVQGLSASSVARFPGTHKTVYISRRYMAALRDAMQSHIHRKET